MFLTQITEGSFLGYWVSVHRPFCLWVSVCLARLGTRQSPSQCPGELGQELLWGLAVWRSCPEEPAAWMLFLWCSWMLLKILGMPVNGFRAWECELGVRSRLRLCSSVCPQILLRTVKLSICAQNWPLT